MHQPVSDIYHLRLNTGEDLIAEVAWPETKKGAESHVILIHPMKIICLPSKKAGFVTLSLMQWVFTKITEDQQFNIFSRDILTMSRPTDSLIQYYKETIDYFHIRQSEKELSEVEDYFDKLEKEIKAVEESDRAIDDNIMDSELQDIIAEFINSLSSNNKGTLH